MEAVSFTRMDQGTAAEYHFLEQLEVPFKAGAADRVLAHLALLGDSYGGYRVSRLGHSLQTASRAAAAAAEEEVIVAALLHDIGDVLAPHNHSELAATILKPFVSEKTWWVVRHHGIFQGYYFWHHLGGDRNAREAYRGHPHFAFTAEFCERWDQTSFDPDYPSLPLEAFAPMVRRVFSRPSTFRG
ncbi:MAG: HD domain-containing protein [Alphaproteobacteria bacterium]|nr:HD domain-containing protein [Alphaproteobacteria bacterium]